MGIGFRMEGFGQTWFRAERRGEEGRARSEERVEEVERGGRCRAGCGRRFGSRVQGIWLREYGLEFRVSG